MDNIGRGSVNPIIYISDCGFFDYYYAMKRIYKCTKNGKRYRHGILVLQCMASTSNFKDRTFIKNGQYRKVKNFAKRMN